MNIQSNQTQFLLVLFFYSTCKLVRVFSVAANSFYTAREDFVSLGPTEAFQFNFWRFPTFPETVKNRMTFEIS